MGGPRSGTWYRWDKKSTVEDFRQLDIRALQRAGLLDQPGMSGWVWRDGRTGEKIGSIRIQVEADQLILHYQTRGAGENWREVTDSVPLDRTPCHFGGDRPWFRCPGCGSRRAILYGGSHFRCRKCYALPYASQSEPEYDRLFRRGRKIRQRLGGELGALCPFPPKPKGMHWRTYYRLRSEVLKVEGEGWRRGLARFGLGLL